MFEALSLGFFLCSFRFATSLFPLFAGFAWFYWGSNVLIYTPFALPSSLISLTPLHQILCFGWVCFRSGVYLRPTSHRKIGSYMGIIYGNDHIWSSYTGNSSYTDRHIRSKMIIYGPVYDNRA